MCGIVGVLSAGPLQQARAFVDRMVSCSRHRGPDGSGAVAIPLEGEEGVLALGHTRLSIIDLSDLSAQPMSDPATGSFLIYNGEIYNFREIRNVLEIRGVVFRTTGDTEVLLKALVNWGADAIPRLEGMFAFAFWDGRKRELLLARDPLGIKPLYYFQKQGLFLFGSELKVMRASGAHDFELDKDGIESYLMYGTVVGPSTALRGVRELVPGHCAAIARPEGPLSVNEYWSLSAHLGLPGSGEKRKFKDASDSIAHLFHSSVKSHLISDVPVGVFLSGGVDSGLIARMASFEQKDMISLLTVDYDRQEFSEAEEAKRVADQLGLEHRIIHVSGEGFKSILPKVLESLDQPTVDGINTFVISHAAASVGLKVLLSGVGGDELFGGYTTFRKVPMLFRHNGVIRPMAPVLRRFSGNAIQWEKVQSVSRKVTIGDVYLLQRCIRWDRFRNGEANGGDRLLMAGDEEWRRIQSLGDGYSTVAGMEIYFYLRNQLLRDTDVVSMANSVEIRVPFLDLPLVAAALRLDAECHFDWRGGKRITRNILSRCGAGKKVGRKKKGFLFPWEYWLRHSLKETIAETLLAEELYRSLPVDCRYGRQIMEAFHKGDPLVSWSEVWSLFVLLDWQRRFRYGAVAS